MVFFRGRNSMRFYMPAKPCKWGFKFHSLVDSQNHYLYNIIDSGKKYKSLIAPIDDQNLAFQIVLSLLEGLEGKGYTVYYDSWYSSILLIEKLTELKFKKKAKYFPDSDEIKNSSKKYCYNNDKHCMIQLFIFYDKF